ncbi:MAG: Do family serine endopeptidase [Bacteroidetes bacterium]|nr:Do family serine endopeptidase [Bacteroidota bacterium]
MKKYVGIFLIAVMGGFVSLGLYKAFEKKHTIYYPKPEGIPVRQVALYGPGEPGTFPDFETAASVSVHAVVHIKSEFQKKSLVYDDFFQFFNFGNPSPREYISPYSAMGSGVIVSADGYIVTNNHVVQDAVNVTVTLNDKRVYKAKIVGTDPSTDLALIRIEESNLPFLAYGNSDEVKIGEWVLAVGNPFNLTSTVTAGIVSAKARDINILGSKGAVESFIQTDAAINPGNSGGALVNTRGELIGINAAIASGTGYYTGYSFAIPVNIVKKVVDDFTKYGKIQRAYLGVYYSEIDDQFAKDNGLNSLTGVYVNEVVFGGAAEKAGIQKGDIITGIQNKPVNGKSELMEIVSQLSPGDVVSVTIIRDGKQIELPVRMIDENSTNVASVDAGKLQLFGATFELLSDKEKSKYGLSSGFKITRIEPGKFSDAGIKPGFILVNVDRQRINSTRELKDALTGKDGGVLVEGLYPNGMRAYYGLGL